MSQAPKGQYIFVVYNRGGRRAIAQAIWKKTFAGWQLRSVASFGLDQNLLEGWVNPSDVVAALAPKESVDA